MMTVTVKLSQNDFFKANLAVLLKKRVMLLILSFMSLIILSNTVMALVSGRPALAEVLPAFIVLVIFGSLMYFAVRRNYAGNKRAAETIHYTFNDATLVIQGESFRSELSWDKIPKVTVGKKWLLVWQNNQAANAIPVSNLPANGLGIIKNIMEKNGVKTNF